MARVHTYFSSTPLPLPSTFAAMKANTPYKVPPSILLDALHNFRGWLESSQEHNEDQADYRMVKISSVDKNCQPKLWIGWRSSSEVFVTLDAEGVLPSDSTPLRVKPAQPGPIFEWVSGTVSSGSYNTNHQSAVQPTHAERKMHGKRQRERPSNKP